MPKSCCTHWFSGWWNACCCQHDLDYYKSGLSRKESDKRLFLCVLFELQNRISFWGTFHPKEQRTNFEKSIAISFLVLISLFAIAVSFPIATMMWIAVRIFGRSRYERKQSRS